jgi:hypothetical protein
MEGFPSYKMVRWFSFLDVIFIYYTFWNFIHQKVFWTEHGTLIGNWICFCIQWLTFMLCKGTNSLLVSLHLTLGQKQIWCQKCCFLLRYLDDRLISVILQVTQNCSFLLSETAIDIALCHTSTQEATFRELTSRIQFLHYEAWDFNLKAVIILIHTNPNVK